MQQLKTLCLSLILFLLTTTSSFAQKTVTVYRDISGNLYSVGHIDSAASQGFPVTINHRATVGDTTFLDFEMLTTTSSFAQNTVKVYRDKSGKLYSVSYIDSVALLGFPIAVIRSTTVGDTTFHDYEILPKPPKEGTEFVQRYKNKALPSFQLKSLEGEIIDNKALQGKVVMINFWSTTCGPCIQEMPELNKLKKQYKEVVFLAPAPEDIATVKKILAKYPFDFIILTDAKKLFKEWGVDGYPKNFFVDREGIIREVREGTPMNRKTVNDKWEIGVVQTYSPILRDLVHNKSK